MRVAIIPARGGSKRIPGKNTKLFHGKPMIRYAIQTAIASGMFDHVFVSTENVGIAYEVRDAGAWPLLRPDNLAEIGADDCGTQAVVQHVLKTISGPFEDHYRDNLMGGGHGQTIVTLAPIEHACCIYPCTPLLRPESLIESYDMLIRQQQKQFIFAVGKFASPIHLALELLKTGGVRQVMPQLAHNKSLPDRYYDAGAFYWGTANAFIDGLDLYQNAIPYVIKRAIDINDEDDWRMAEIVFRGLNQHLESDCDHDFQIVPSTTHEAVHFFCPKCGERMPT